MRLFAALLTLPLFALAPLRAVTPEEAEFFEKKVRPVLAEQCYKCHGAEKQKAALRVDSRAAILKGTEDGPVIVEGKPEQSSFIKSIRHEGDSKMPEKADKLADTQIADLTAWVRMGMPWPEGGAPEKLSVQQAAAATHWSWQPLKVAAVIPGVASPIDASIRAQLAAKGIQSSPPAPKRTLIRRATYDLTGLPPTAAEVEAFEKDAAPDAFAKVVDRLLASPRYGERWGRHWLDVARYADTKGYLAGNESRNFPYSYTYRDWVISALNADLPYDQFIIQQIAGDQIATAENPVPNAALGFLTLGRRFLNNQADIIDDRIDVVSRGLMGLTVACARCHDHKFDPISQADYYALYGVFASSKEPETKDLPLLPATRDPKIEADYQKQLAERQAALAEFHEGKRQLIALRTLPTLGVFAVVPPDSVRRVLDRAGKDEERKFINKIEDLNAGPLSPPRAMALVEGNVVKPRIFKRGNPGNPGDEVPRRFLSVLSGGKPEPFKNGSGRLELARAIASRDNPLTARVMVNRVWAGHFGKGLVRTPGDFGTKGEAPTNAGLLDWLAAKFIADGWSLKKLHRTILLSATWQQASDERPDAMKADPENRLVWRMNRRRLDFESMRDSLLACSSQLDTAMGGLGQDIAATRRRTVYALVDRQNLPGVFRTFDFASPDTTNPQRFVTTVPQQALFMMNSPFVIDRARALTAAPPFQQPSAYEPQIHELYQRILARRAAPGEVDAGLRFVSTALATPPGERGDDKPAWQYGYGSFNAATARTEFQPLPDFSGSEWKGGAKLPVPVLGFTSLNKDGGHPGPDAAHCAIRRWTAPKDGVIAIAGNIRRPAAEGDGVLARIVSSRAGELLKVDVAPAKEAEAKLDRVQVKAGETLDFLVDPRTGDNSDGFRWHPTITGDLGTFDSQAQFAGPPPAPPAALKPWEQYAQVLLETNEFVFLD